MWDWWDRSKSSFFSSKIPLRQVPKRRVSRHAAEAAWAGAVLQVLGHRIGQSDTEAGNGGWMVGHWWVIAWFLRFFFDWVKTKNIITTLVVTGEWLPNLLRTPIIIIFLNMFYMFLCFLIQWYEGDRVGQNLTILVG